MDICLGVAGHVYGLIKAAMLWVVPGMLLSLMAPRASIQRWAVFAVAVCFLGGWVILPAMGWNEAREVLFALPVWLRDYGLSERVQRSIPFSNAATAALGATIEPAARSAPPRLLFRMNMTRLAIRHE